MDSTMVNNCHDTGWDFDAMPFFSDVPTHRSISRKYVSY